MNRFAQVWANELAKTGRREHRKNNTYGENIFFTTDPKNLGEKAVESWYLEILKFRNTDGEPELAKNSDTRKYNGFISTLYGVTIVPRLYATRTRLFL